MLGVICGTRPEFIKLQPLLKALDAKRKPYKLIAIGQHTDLLPADVDITVEDRQGINRLDTIFSTILSCSNIFQGVTQLLVQGDTATAAATALGAFHRGIPVIHLEAGLRSYDVDSPFPEESYRRMISSVSSYNLCPTEVNYNNLLLEQSPGESFVVGNTVLDNLSKEGTSYGNKVLITLHRRENHTLIGGWFSKLNALSKEFKDLDFVFINHPNPSISDNVFLLSPSITVLEPQDHEGFIELLKECRFVVSDSGGLQEECSWLNKRIIVCRQVTERTESLGTSSILCPVPGQLPNIFRYVAKDYKINYPCPYGQGDTAEKILSLGII